MKLYFIQEHLDRQHVFHGGTGNIDAEKIFLQKGFQPILFPCRQDFTLKAKLLRVLYLIKVFFSLPAGSVVIFQFPLDAGLHKWLIRALTFRENIRIISFVVDIDGIKDGDQQLLKAEISSLQTYQYFIVHNDTMKQWLQSITTPRSVVCIDFFDFLTSPVENVRKKSFEIAFAGNLEKSVFLQSLGQLIPECPFLIFNIYGTNPPQNILQQTNVQYEGFKQPYSMPAALKGSFGLVWDGDGIGQPGGSLGDYMKYISHHKLSLYILSGMPVITYKGTASAALAIKHHIGIAVQSLNEVEKVIQAMSEENYLQMAANTKQLAKLISEGQMLGKAIDQILAAE